MLANTGISLINAAVRVLRPFVKILLRNGIDYGTFAEVVRKVYVDVGLEELQAGGQRPTISGVAAMTGLTRKEAKRLKDLDTLQSEVTHQRYNRAIRVISGWLNDSRFLDKNNKPARLPIDDGENSFTALVKTYSGDIPPLAMLSVLEASNSAHSDSGYVSLLQHAYIPEASPTEKIDILGTDVGELIETIGHNLNASGDQLHFQRKVSNCLISDASAKAFQKLSAQKSQQLLEELNSWLGEHEVPKTDCASSENDAVNYVALGIYFTQQPTTDKV